MPIETQQSALLSIFPPYFFPEIFLKTNPTLVRHAFLLLTDTL